MEMEMVVNNFPDDPEFGEIVASVEAAIDAGVNPEMIVRGTSGSYFAKNAEGVSLATV